MPLHFNICFSPLLKHRELTGLYPTFIQAPANGPSVEYTDITSGLNSSLRYVNCSVQLNKSSVLQEYWAISQLSPYILSSTDDRSDFIEMIIYSNRIAPPVFNAIAGIG